MARTIRALVGFTVAWLALTPGSVSADDRADVLALDALIAAAVIAGDTAFVAERTADDFVMVHGDAWTRGRQPLLVDGKESLLSRVAARYYDVLDFDSVQAELHGDVALTFGRYLAHVARAGDPERAWFSVRYERVYAKRGGRWQYLSHRTVHGPVFGAQRAAVVDDAAASLPADGPLSVPAPGSGAAELLNLEREIGAAVVRGDAEYFAKATAADFVMTHGDAWTRGGPPALVDDQASFLRRVASKSYAAHDYEVQAAELHGDVGITYGRYVGHIPSSPPDRRWFYVWYQKVYAKRDGRWVYLSHRTVDGAHYAADRAGLGDLHAP